MATGFHGEVFHLWNIDSLMFWIIICNSLPMQKNNLHLLNKNIYHGCACIPLHCFCVHSQYQYAILHNLQLRRPLPGWTHPLVADCSGGTSEGRPHCTLPASEGTSRLPPPSWSRGQQSTPPIMPVREGR